MLKNLIRPVNIYFLVTWAFESFRSIKKQTNKQKKMH